MRATTGQRRFGVSVITTLSVAALTLTACGGEATGGAGGEAEKDYSSLNLATSTEPRNWDPALQESAFDGMWQWTAVYDRLLTCEEDGSVTPGAAEDYEFTDDNTVLTLNLREDMTFEDGTPVDSEAVKASIEHIQEGEGSAAVRVAGIEVETPDEHTVVLTSPEPRGLLPAYMCLSTGIIASPEVLEAGEADSQPVASGPYTFNAERSTAGSVMTFEKRDDYWNADAYPYEEIVVTVMPDVTARMNALRTGQADGAILNAETVAEAESAGLNIYEWQDATNGIVIFDRDGEQVEALGDPRVRQAMNMVFDREGIAEGTFQGHAEPTSQMFMPEAEGYVEDLEDTYDYDVEAAQDLMEEAGYADGFTIEIPSRTPQTDQANPLIVQQLAELNITVEEVPLAASVAVPEILSGRFPMTYISMPQGSGLWNVDQSIKPGATWNVHGNTSSELDELTEQAEAAQDDELVAVLEEINEYVVEDAWFIPWNNRTAYFATAGAVELATTGDVYSQIPQLRDFQ